MLLKPEEVTISISGNVAIITLARGPANAMTPESWALLAQRMREADKADTLITILTGKGRFFSAGADVKASVAVQATGETQRVAMMQKFGAGSIDVIKAFSDHTKILIAAVNGPVVGLTAALLGHADFIIAQEGAYLVMPFAALGLVSEGGSSLTFVQRMGISKAKEALLFGKKMDTAELKACGFVNEVFPKSDNFVQQVVKYSQDRFSALDPTAVLGIKKLIHSFLPDRDMANMREMLQVADLIESGSPAKYFLRVAAKL